MDLQLQAPCPTRPCPTLEHRALLVQMSLLCSVSLAPFECRRVPGKYQPQSSGPLVPRQGAIPSAPTRPFHCNFCERQSYLACSRRTSPRRNLKQNQRATSYKRMNLNKHLLIVIQHSTPVLDFRTFIAPLSPCLVVDSFYFESFW